MRTILLSLTAFVFPLFAGANVGFQTGNSFISTYVEGEVSVTCRNGFEQTSAAFRCYSNLLDPAEMAKVVGPKGLAADRIHVKATREDGTILERSEGYDPSTGLSKGRFNLWIHTLLQRPLLKMGMNEIEVRYTQGSSTLLEERFQALVTAGPDRFCRFRRHYSSNNMDDCRNGSFVCNRYFQDENYCQR
jgi:hypothetical protein